VTLGGERLFSAHAYHAPHCPKSLPARLQETVIEKIPASPFGNQAEIIQAVPDTIPEQYAAGPDTGDADRKYWNTCGGS